MSSSGSFSLCVVDALGKVIDQNGCERICTVSTGSVCNTVKLNRCELGVMREEVVDAGIHTFKGREINGHFFDVVVVRVNQDKTYTFSFPLQERLDAFVAATQECPLTKREREVASLMVLGLSNDRIVQRLNISRNTLRVHQKSIYRKLPAEARRLVEHRVG